MNEELNIKNSPPLYAWISLISPRMKKGTILENIAIEKMAAEGKSIAYVDGLVLFVTGGVPGDVADVELTKIKSSFLEGRVKQIRSYSAHRTTPFCNHFGTCGGCQWQHLDYQVQLAYKQQQVIDNLTRLGGLTLPDVLPIVASAKIKQYRNRLDFSASAQRWLTHEELKSGIPFGEPALGFHVPKSFDKVFDVQECFLQPDPSNAIRLFIKACAINNNIPFFDLRKQTGYLRTVTIRTAATGDVMVIVQVAYDDSAALTTIMDQLATKFPEITALHYVINTKRNDTFNDLDVHVWKGLPYITEKMRKPENDGDLFFRVGPKSFYQTNSQQAFELYNIAYDFAELQGDELVYDLYTGTGTIANFVAGKARHVVGLEYVEAAVEDARVNSAINNITNTSFFSGDMKDLLDEKFLDAHGRPDVIITDPPRAGMHEDVCRMIVKAAPKKIVYVSCNPATQARDLAILAEHYMIDKVQPVDMFPHTMHVENVVRLTLKH